MLSIVLPCYNEEEIIKLSLTTLESKLSEFNITDYEIICVDDGSKDDTLNILEQLVLLNAKLKVVSFSANRGQQIAFYAGMSYSSGDAVILMDADLQDPPDLIPAMLEKWKEGYKVVYGKRIIRVGESWLKRLTAYLFYRFLNKISYVDIPQDVGEFRLMDRCVVNVIINMPEHNRFNRALVSYIGFKQYEMPFERPERLVGVTKFGWKDMIRLAKDGIFSFSDFPVMVLQFFGLFSIFLSLLLFVYVIVSWFFGVVSGGWTSLMSVIIFFSGTILFSLGIIGEYIIRIYTESLKRPLFITSKTINLDDFSRDKKS